MFTASLLLWCPHSRLNSGGILTYSSNSVGQRYMAAHATVAHFYCHYLKCSLFFSSCSKIARPLDDTMR